jgi:hypothetical protein
LDLARTLIAFCTGDDFAICANLRVFVRTPLCRFRL